MYDTSPEAPEAPGSHPLYSFGCWSNLVNQATCLWMSKFLEFDFISLIEHLAIYGCRDQSGALFKMKKSNVAPAGQH